MAYQHKTNIATKNSNIYSSVDQFLLEHGPLGLRSSAPQIESATAVLNDAGTGSIRTIIFNSEADMEAWHEITRDFPGRQQNVSATLISKGEV